MMLFWSNVVRKDGVDIKYAMIDKQQDEIMSPFDDWLPEMEFNVLNNVSMEISPCSDDVAKKNQRCEELNYSFRANDDIERMFLMSRILEVHIFLTWESVVNGLSLLDDATDLAHILSWVLLVLNSTSHWLSSPKNLRH
ncbi:hypothetical protein Tco_0073739 [Tanacetum coccineum]